MITNILEYLERSAKKSPDKIAFADADRALTYSELVDSARRVASYILEKGPQSGVAAVLIGRNVESIIAFFGAAYAGCSYVPVSVYMPVARIERILEQSEPDIIFDVSDEAMSEPLDERFASRTAGLLDALSHEADEGALAAVRDAHIDTDPLYILFTSGSTGVPKGVVVSHRGVINLVEQFSAAFPFDENDVLGNQAPFDFDVSTKDIYMTIGLGATCQIIPRTLFGVPKRLLEYINERRVTVGIWAVSVMTIIANFKAFAKIMPEHLRMVMFSGEALPTRILNYWREYLPDITYVNLYGPTEITCNCTYYIVDRKFENTEALPIGRAFPNMRVFLLDSSGRAVTEPGVEGEICVSGAGVSLGYYGNAEKTQGAFVQRPDRPNYHERMYRTGDLGKYNALGELVFLGRRDFQIKHMGHRIELGEIETAVNSLDIIETACCLYNTEAEKIWLFYQSDKECRQTIAKALAGMLPKYMLPNVYQFMEQMPLNKNRKIDRVLLRETYFEKKDEE